MSRPFAARRQDANRRGLTYGAPALYMGPNQSSLLYDWTPTADNVTLNGADAVSVLCRDRFYQSVPGLEVVQATAAKQALWNAADADFGGQPTLEFAGAEQYQTTNAFTLPNTCTVVVVCQDQNAGAFTSITESSPFYSSANGGFAAYINGSFWRAAYNFTNVTDKTLASPGGATAGRIVLVYSFDTAGVGLAAIPLARGNNTNFANGGALSTAGTFRSCALMIGGRAASQFFVGPWARTRIYTGTFTSAQADAEYTYQKARFGLP